MPMDDTCEEYVCDHPNCGKVFLKPYEFERHVRTHCKYEEREFVCPFIGCGFRANQRGGVKHHFNSIHAKIRLPCDEPGCDKTFSDPSSRTKHRQKFHGARWLYHRAPSHKRKSSVQARVTHPVEQHSQEDTKDVLKQSAMFATSRSSGTSHAASSLSDGPSSDPNTGPSTSHGASAAPSSSVYKPDYIMQPPPCELRGVFHRANGVPADGGSFDDQQLIHQRAYNANPDPAPMAWGHHPDAPAIPPRPQPTLGHPRQALHPGLQTIPDEFGSLTLAPLQGQDEEMRRGTSLPNEAPIPFSSPGMGHVPPSDHQWSSLPPNSLSSAYLRPNPRMLFSTPGIHLNR